MSVRPVRFGRRRMLHAAVAGAIGLPWLETFAGKTAHAAPALPKRFVAMFSPNGTIRERWLPTGSETNFTLSPILAPLAPHQSDLVIVSGVDQMGAGGDLGHDATEAGVQVGLRCDDAGQHGRLVGEDGSARLVAGGFNAQEMHAVYTHTSPSCFPSLSRQQRSSACS